MKRLFYGVSAAIALLLAPAAYANDIENAINKYGGKIGIRGSAANMLNSQIRNVTSKSANPNPNLNANLNAGQSIPNATTTTTTTTTTSSTTTTKVGSLKSAFEKVFAKNAGNNSLANPLLPNPVTNIPATLVPAASALPAVTSTTGATQQQSVKAKIGKEIWRQAKKYESKHH
ncbi:hypothetical protein BH11CYA1_BH11CYA1_01210 [soil metagenome]